VLAFQHFTDNKQLLKGESTPVCLDRIQDRDKDSYIGVSTNQSSSFLNLSKFQLYYVEKNYIFKQGLISLQKPIFTLKSGRIHPIFIKKRSLQELKCPFFVLYGVNDFSNGVFTVESKGYIKV